MQYNCRHTIAHSILLAATLLLDKMTQLYVGNLSAEGDEKSIRLLFGKYGTVREVLMKSGYAFVEFELPMSAEDAMRELNGELLC